jgi:4-amino-4-deoxy-L-arabinose transferase-like glycosyltransferase
VESVALELERRDNRRFLRVRWTTVVLLVIVGWALYLRLHGVGWGLPYNFLNPDEGTIVPKAFHIAGGHLDPRFFYYPSLFFYLLAGLYRVIGLFWHPAVGPMFRFGTFTIDPGPYYLAGRLLVVALGTASVYLVYRLGREAFSSSVGLVAAAFLAVEPLHVRYSHVAVTDVPATAFALLAMFLLLRAARGGGRRWLLAGAIAAGLATSIKYNLGMLVIPATVAGLIVGRPQEPARLRARHATLARAWFVMRRVYVPMLLAFIVTTPFAILDAGRFVHDFARQNQIVASGWLGYEHVGNSYWYNFSVNLAGALGLVLLSLVLAGLAYALWRHSLVDLIIAPYAALYFLYVSSWHALPDRYLLPIVPLLLVLAARLCVALSHIRLKLPRLVIAPAVATVLCAAIVLPLSDSMAYDRSLSGVDMRSVAKQWVERHIRPGVAVASDTYGPPLVTSKDLRFFVAAGIASPFYNVYPLKLPVPGGFVVWPTLAQLRHDGVRYVIVSSSVYDRITAAARQYPRQAAFYWHLRRSAKLVKVFRPQKDERGPWLKVYSI